MIKDKINLLKIPENKFVSCSNDYPVRVKWNDVYANKKNILRNLNMFLGNNYYDIYENNYIFKISYNLENGNDTSIPKTSRLDFKFGKKFETIKDVYQIGSSINKIMNNKSIDLYYKIPKADYEAILKKINVMYETLTQINNKEEWEKSIFYREVSYGIFVKTIDKIKSISKNVANIDFKENIIVRILDVMSLEELNQKLSSFVENFDNKLINTGPFLSLILSWNELLKIQELYPWIIQKEENFSSLSAVITDFKSAVNEIEPIYYNEYTDYPKIGVIDSGSNLPESFEKFIISNETILVDGGVRDLEHGSIVNSIIIANDEMNKTSRDGLGNFQIKHFEILNKVEEKDQLASVDYSHILNNLENIIKSNYENIQIWNISFGARKNPWSPEISPAGMFLDYLSAKYNVLFVVASGNHGVKYKKVSLNTPADSLNSLSVGSVFLNSKNQIESNDFSSFGTTLRLMKPEISYFGGPNNSGGDFMIGCSNLGAVIGINGTSYSAPRISRMAAWIIKKLKFSPMEAKAFILMSSSHLKYSNKYQKITSLYGVVNTLDFENFIWGELEISNNQPIVLKFDFTGVEKVKISYSFIANPIRNFGIEYSISDLEAKIIALDDSKGWEKQIFRKNGSIKKTTLKSQSNSIGSYLKEDQKTLFYDNYEYQNEDKLISKGKYFNSRTKIYDLNSEENQNILIKYNKIAAFTLKRTDLINIEKSQPLKVGIVIKFYGKDLSIEQIYKNNNWLENKIININENIVENINE